MDRSETHERYNRLAKMCRDRANQTSSVSAASTLNRMAEAYECKASSDTRTSLFRFAEIDRPKRLGPHASEFGLD